MISNMLMKLFKNSDHPGNDNLLGKGCIDISEIEFLFDYEGLCWSEIPRETLKEHSSCFFFLSDQGIKYVLPAYLSLCFDEGIAETHDYIDLILNALSTKGHGLLEFDSDQASFILKYFVNRLEEFYKKTKNQEYLDDIVLPAKHHLRKMVIYHNKPGFL